MAKSKKSPVSPTKEEEFIATRRTRRRVASKPIENPRSPVAAVDPGPPTSSSAGTSVDSMREQHFEPRSNRGKTGRVKKIVREIELAKLQDLKAEMKNVKPAAAVDPGLSTWSGAGTSVSYRGKTGRVKKTVQKIELAKLQDLKAEMKNVEPAAAVDAGTSYVLRKSRRACTAVGSMRRYFESRSHRCQVVRVKKEVREKELAKLQDLKTKMLNVKGQLDSMDLESHPDGGGHLIVCLAELEQAVREQGNYVARMLVDNDMHEHEEEKVKNGQVIEKDLSREKINTRRKGPKDEEKYKQQRNHMLDSLKGFQEALASRPPEEQESAAPPQLLTTLMPHQLHALAWLRWRETQQPCGGILADDMGLGKTITILSLVVGEENRKGDDDELDAYVKKKSKMVRGGTLVVCPATLAQQWQDEVRKHCATNAISVCLHHGRNRAKYAHRLAVFDLVITTYNILHRENVLGGALMKVHWHRVVLDEAHIVRNPDTATSRAVFALHAACRWALTGTPVHNKDLDLFSLLKFLRCKPFDERAMFKQWLDKSKLGQERLNAIMSCILLRRTKIQLQNKGELTCLPSKNMVLNEVTLSKDEMDVYQKVLLFSKSLFAKFLAGKNAAGKLQTPHKKMYEAIHQQMVALQGNKPVKSQHILVLLLRLRQVCCHCGLIAVQDNKASGNDDLLNELGKMSLNDDETERESDSEDVKEVQEETAVTTAIRSVFSANNPVFDRGHPSSKIQAVMECLRNNVFVQKDDKAVVVSQWTSVLRLVEDELTSLNVRSVTLSGAVSVKARQGLVNELNDPSSDVKVMLLSLCAGGVGLNLCGANHLLLLDPHWNPQLEEQAQDRVYRLGQTKPVHIFRFICVDTVEQSIHRLQRSKLALADCVLTGGTNGHSNLNIEDLKLLFNMCH